MSKKPTLLVTGGSGYLGRHLARQALRIGTVYAAYASQPASIKAGTPCQLDLADQDQVHGLIAEISPDAIIHTAYAKGDEETMLRINADGSGFVAEAAVAVGARLVHVSTDALHDGTQAPYDDDAPPTPITAYGRSKAAAEASIKEIDPKAAIVRTSLIYGLQEMDHGSKGFADRLQAGQPLLLFRDMIRQPVWVETLAEALLKLAFEQTDFAGTLNVVGAQAMSREAFGKRMLAWWQVDNRYLAQPTLAADLPNAGPLDVRLTIVKAEALLGMTFPGVDQVLSQAR